MSADRFRIGRGFDVHRFSKKFDPDKPLMLGGLKIEKSREAFSLTRTAMCTARSLRRYPWRDR